MELLHHGVFHLGRTDRRQALMLAPPERTILRRQDWVQAAVVAAVLLLLYASTSPRTVALEDDGLFVLSSYFLGIEHPPGYPLFTLLGHLFTYLPFGSVAYRVHLASALFGALSCAAAWLCARALIPGRLPAYVAAFGLGFSPVFWSQSIIAEVYTLNTFFFLILAVLGLQACPSPAQPSVGGAERRILPWMAFVFGLSLSNHWPLMLLAAPAFAVLLWPARQEILRRFGLLTWLVLLGLAPYAWMVYRSWRALPISFDGPLETLPEIWFFITRKGYAGVDQSVSADWLDRLKFFQFLGGQLLVQFAVAGTLLAAAGFAVQARVFGRRIAGFLTLAFLMPTAVLLLLLGFDYTSATKHVFHVYPLPAYAVVALWAGLGFAWLANRYALRTTHATAGAAAIVALVFAAGSRENLRADHDWGARYAQTVLKALPAKAVVFAQGDADLVPMAYFHMIENWRPDITLYQPKGLVLGNRLFHPLRTSEEDAQKILREAIERQSGPVVFVLDAYSGYGRRDRWLYSEVDKSAADPAKVSIDIPDEAVQFFEDSIARSAERNAWIAYFQGELRRRYAVLRAQSLSRARTPDARVARHFEILENDFYGALGIAEGLMINAEGYPPGVVSRYLDKASKLMPSDAPKQHLSQFFNIRGVLRSHLGDRQGAIQDLETAVSLWPVADNASARLLEDLYREAGDQRALKAMQERVKRTARHMP